METKSSRYGWWCTHAKSEEPVPRNPSFTHNTSVDLISAKHHPSSCWISVIILNCISLWFCLYLTSKLICLCSCTRAIIIRKIYLIYDYTYLRTIRINIQIKASFFWLFAPLLKVCKCLSSIKKHVQNQTSSSSNPSSTSNLHCSLYNLYIPFEPRFRQVITLWKAVCANYSWWEIEPGSL